MKKFLCMVALAAICLGTVSASITHPVKAVSDTVKKAKTKIKRSKVKTKMKVKDTTVKNH